MVLFRLIARGFNQTSSAGASRPMVTVSMLLFIQMCNALHACTTPVTSCKWKWVTTVYVSVSGAETNVSTGTDVHWLWLFNLELHFAGIGQSLMLLSCNVIIQQRFNKHRSLATGISVMGYSFGNFIGAPLTQLLLNGYGLRGTLALLGAIQSHRIPLALQFRSPERFKTASSNIQVGNCWILWLCS